MYFQVQEGFIVDEDEEIEDRALRRQEKKKRRREDREREEEHLDDEDLELIGEHNPSFQPPVAPDVCCNPPQADIRGLTTSGLL